jgi:hypothetical protein
MATVLKFPIVLSETFIEATRDTGYRSTAAAIAELVDNSIQAGAKNVQIFVNESGVGVTVNVLDDGAGMDANTLRLALQFGGSKRFADRTGMGRFGMGLPNASVSQARRVDVYTWKAPNSCHTSHLDVDEISAGEVDEIPSVRKAAFPKSMQEFRGYSGTLITWSKCDRIDNRRVSTVIRKLHEPLGRMFRHFIWGGVTIKVNGESVQPLDPLFIHKNTPLRGAKLIGDPLKFEVRIPGSDKTSVITVKFSELPVEKWHNLPAEDKRKFGIVDGAGLSILRAGREVDHGWWFFGNKRRENYDSWWRGELSFEPDLDELFSITHSKQGISPTPDLRELLTPDLEAIARQLNGRVQTAFGGIKKDPVTSPAIRVITPPVEPPKNNLRNQDKPRDRVAPKPQELPAPKVKPYTVKTSKLKSVEFFNATCTRGKWTLLINSDHPFYSKLYEMASNKDHLEHLLLAFAKAGGSKKLMATWAAELASLLGTSE